MISDSILDNLDSATADYLAAITDARARARARKRMVYWANRAHGRCTRERCNARTYGRHTRCAYHRTSAPTLWNWGHPPGRHPSP